MPYIEHIPCLPQTCVEHIHVFLKLTYNTFHVFSRTHSMSPSHLCRTYSHNCFPCKQHLLTNRISFNGETRITHFMSSSHLCRPQPHSFSLENNTFARTEHLLMEKQRPLPVWKRRSGWRGNMGDNTCGMIFPRDWIQNSLCGRGLCVYMVECGWVFVRV